MPSLPFQLLESLKQLEQFDEAAFIRSHAEEQRINSIRLNPFKPVELDFTCDAPVKWNSEGYYLHQRPAFILDPLFHAGCYYPQEAGSMFLKLALQQTLDLQSHIKILDVCAAPGGKSTLINSLLNEGSLLVANEIIKSRATVLAENLGKWGTSNTVVTNNDPARFSELPSFFDALVIDAPCSGSGLFRKQPEAIDEWSEAHVKACAVRQEKILADVLPALKHNGILVYSTCSYSVAENEAIVEKLVSEHDMEYVPLAVDASWGLVDSGLGYRFYPHLTNSEGFFCAVLRKKSAQDYGFRSGKKNKAEAGKPEIEIIRPFLTQQEVAILKKNEQFHLVSPAVASFLTDFEKHFYFKKAGVTVGEIKGKDLVPNQELAWFTGLDPAVKRLELDRDTALKFLRKENFGLPENIKGLVLVCYKGKGLGWAKILPNRINNYLPNELRILK